MCLAIRRWTRIAFLLALVPILFSCGGSGDGDTDVSLVPFAVDDTTPADAAAGVPPDSNVTVRWNLPVDCSTVSTTTVATTSPQWERKSCEGSHAIFAPTGQDYETSYRVTVSDNIRSAAGTFQAEPASTTYAISPSPAVWGGTILEGGSGDDSAADGAVDSAGNIYVIGSTSSGLFGNINAGSKDVFVARYDAGGVFQWGIQFGDTGNDRGLGIAFGNGGIYIVGDTEDTSANTFGTPVPGDSLANIDAFVGKLNPTDGSTVWLRRFGTIQDDSARDVTLDASGNIYVAGSTSGTLARSGAAGDVDAFLARFTDAEAGDGLPGSRVWVDQFGQDATAEDAAAVAVTADFVYIAGKTGVADSQGDAYASRHSPSDGSRLSQWRLGQQGVDYANDLAVDARGSLYIAGRSETDIDSDGANVQGTSDAFLARIDPSSASPVQWVEVLASSSEDEAFGVAVDDFGNLYVSGAANEDLVGENNNHQGVGDAFTARFTIDGQRNWLDFLGTAADDTGFEVFLGERGTVFVTGVTNEALDGVVNAGGSDAFLVRYTSAGVLE